MKPVKRIAINVGGGYVAGLNAVIASVVLAADEIGYEVVVIRDGFDELLFSERYPEGGLLLARRLSVRHIDRLWDQFVFGTSYPFSSMAELVEQTLKLPLSGAAIEE